MPDTRNLLVVDDEEVVCQACRRIFSKQGFTVEMNTDARQGLVLATEKDYEIILLDIKMPNMDGIQFLERLREKKPDVPVLIITGYPSIPNAAAAMRLGACDYVTKPFTSEEVTWAVHRVLATHGWLDGNGHASLDGEEVAEAVEKPAETLFWDESWMRLEIDGSACVGAVLPGLRGDGNHRRPVAADRRGSLPGPAVGRRHCAEPALGDRALADFRRGRGHQRDARPAARFVGGRSLRPGLAGFGLHHPARGGNPLQTPPDRAGQRRCGLGRRTSAEVDGLGLRRRADVGPGSGARRGARHRRPGGLSRCRFARRGGTGLGRADQQPRAPHARIVVLGAAGGAWESTYRKHKIFYYAVEAFSDNEIADILAAVFHREIPPAKAERQKGPSEPVNRISIVNRNGHKVQLLAAPGLLWANEGLGWPIGQQAPCPDVARWSSPRAKARSPRTVSSRRPAFAIG